MPVESPKTRFLQDEQKARKWTDLAFSNEFQHCLDTALLQFVHNVRSGGVYEAQSMAHRIEGAREFARILQTLGEIPTAAERKREKTLETPETSVPAHLDPERYKNQPTSQP